MTVDSSVRRLNQVLVCVPDHFPLRSSMYLIRYWWNAHHTGGYHKSRCSQAHGRLDLRIRGGIDRTVRINTTFFLSLNIFPRVKKYIESDIYYKAGVVSINLYFIFEFIVMMIIGFRSGIRKRLSSCPSSAHTLFELWWGNMTSNDLISDLALHVFSLKILPFS